MNPSDRTISISRANWISLLLLIPESLVLIGVYLFFWQVETLSDMISQIAAEGIILELLLLLLMITGIVLHELIHGIAWIIVSGKSFTSLKFGVNWAGLAPYTHCREPMKASSYRWGAAMPGVVLGLFPYLLSLAMGNGWLLMFGFIFTIMATGDAIILWVTRDLEPDTLVHDHPSKAGCEIVSG